MKDSLQCRIVDLRVFHVGFRLGRTIKEVLNSKIYYPEVVGSNPTPATNF